MPVIIPGRSENSPSTIKETQLRFYSANISRNLVESIQATTRTAIPTTLALDGWLAAVQCFYCMSHEGFEPDLAFDPIIKLLVEKVISPREINIETIAFTTRILDSVESSKRFEREIQKKWDLLCASKGFYGATDHLQLKLDYSSESSNSPKLEYLVQLRQYLPFPLSGGVSSINPSQGDLGPYFIRVTFEGGEVDEKDKKWTLIPKSAVFFFSRLQHLRRLSHQAEVYGQHHHTISCTCETKLNFVEDRISQVVLQMLLYFRSMEQYEKSKTLLGSKHTEWIELIELGDRFENETFGSWGFERNREFIRTQYQLGESGRIIRMAARWTYPSSFTEQAEVRHALREMEAWLIEQFDAIKEYKDLQKSQEREDISKPFVPRARAVGSPHRTLRPHGRRSI